jgi:hypothetical protein
MKKAFLLSLVSLLALGSFAQDNPKSAKHGKKAGMKTCTCPPSCPCPPTCHGGCVDLK